MMAETTDIRLKRAEQDIETLRATQTAILDLIDRLAASPTDKPNITVDNRSRLEREEDQSDRLLQLARGNRDILRAIADHYGLTYQKPDRSFHSNGIKS